jgi:hypothetical protein
MQPDRWDSTERCAAALDAELLSQHYFYDTANRDDAKIFGVLEYDLSPQTLDCYRWQHAVD